MNVLLGVDVGGTFTDFVAYDPESRGINVWKVPSVPGDPVAGILDGIAQELPPEAIRLLRLGTTVATNAILERKGATVAYVTTRGFRDVPFIQRGNRKFHYDMSWVKPKPLVKRRHCFEGRRAHRRGRQGHHSAQRIRSRRGSRGDPQHAGDQGGRRLLPLFLPQSGARAARQGDPLRASRRSADLDLVRGAAEVEGIRARFNTLADAYLKPVVSSQLWSMRERLDKAGVRAPSVVIKSNGGEMSLEAAARAPVNLAMSGPTGGVIASRYPRAAQRHRQFGDARHGRHVDRRRHDPQSSGKLHTPPSRSSGACRFRSRCSTSAPSARAAARSPGSTPAACYAWGPQSAGAKPGPACYGTGGVDATVTDRQCRARQDRSQQLPQRAHEARQERR